jgi:outer membrane protein assembly factor BamB
VPPGMRASWPKTKGRQMNSDNARDMAEGLTMLRRYMDAMESSDLDTVARIVHLAETDEALERMVLVANDAYLEHLATASKADTTPATDRVDTPLLSQTPYTFPPTPPTTAPPHRGPRWLGTLVAALLVIALLSGFFALYSGHSIFGQFINHLTPDNSTIIVARQKPGRVYALHASTGSVIWSWSDVVILSIIRSNDAVYIESYGPNDNGGNTSRITALRASNGTKLWEVSTVPGTWSHLAGYIDVALDGDTLVIGSIDANGMVVGVNVHTGAVLWTQHDTSGLLDRLITATNGHVYTSNINGFSAYDIHSGKFLWSYTANPVLTTSANGPAIIAGSGGLVYFYQFDAMTADQQEVPVLNTLDATTGAFRQRLESAQIGNPILVTADGITFTAKDSRLCAFRIAGATLLWCTDTIDGSDASLRLVPSPQYVLYSRIVDGRVEVGALDSSTGSQLWSWHGIADHVSVINSMSLAGANGVLFLTTYSGIYAFDMATGTVLWHALSSIDLSYVQPALAR